MGAATCGLTEDHKLGGRVIRVFYDSLHARYIVPNPHGRVVGLQQLVGRKVIKRIQPQKVW